MPFMGPDIFSGEMWTVDTTSGVWNIPADIVDMVDEETPDIADFLPPNCTGDDVWGVEKQDGYWARLSAPGYLDATDWQGPYETVEQAMTDLAETFDICERCWEQCWQRKATLTLSAYCGMSVPIAEDWGDRSTLRKIAARLLKQRRKEGYPVILRATGREWEICEREGSVMVLDHCGILSLEGGECDE